MKALLRLLRVLATGKSETLNGYTAGVSLLAVSLLESVVPVSKLPSVPFIHYMLANYALLVLSSIAGGCVALARSTVLYSKGRTYPMVLFSLLLFAVAIVAFAAGMLFGQIFSGAVEGLPYNPSLLLALSLLSTSLFTMTLATRDTFAMRAAGTGQHPAGQHS